MNIIFAKTKGVTLVELIVALALSSFLAIGVIQIYLDSRQTDDMGGALARIQETGRVALDIMTEDIRGLGYVGCLDPKTLPEEGVLQVVANNSPLEDITAEGLRGFEVEAGWADDTEFNDTDIETDAISDSDVIAIQRMTRKRVSVVKSNAPAPAPGAVVLESDELDIVENDLVLVSNCTGGHLFRVSNVVASGSNTLLEHSDSVNNMVDAFPNYSGGDEANVAVAMKFMSVAYFVADTGRKNPAGDAVFALYRQRDKLVNAAVPSFDIEEILEGVETLQILYGERLSDDSVRFVRGNDADLDMRNVESVRIGVLVSSTRNVQQANDMQSYLLPGGKVSPAPSDGLSHPADKRIRRAFSTTVYLRNRPNRPDSV